MSSEDLNKLKEFFGLTDEQMESVFTQNIPMTEDLISMTSEEVADQCKIMEDRLKVA